MEWQTRCVAEGEVLDAEELCFNLDEEMLARTHGQAGSVELG